MSSQTEHLHKSSRIEHGLSICECGATSAAGQMWFTGHVNITIELPPEFIRLCKRDDVKPEMVLRGFIADVSGIQTWAFPDASQGRMPRPNDGYQSNGSDERMMAREYYDRVGYPYTADCRLKTEAEGGK